MSRFQLNRIPHRGVAASRIALALSVSIGCLVFAGCNRDNPRRPNLILITADQLAANELTCFGGPQGSGKSLCRLGREGTLFGWTMAAGSGIASSAASMLTGLSESAHGVDESGLSFLNDHHRSLPEILADAGYATAAFIESPKLNRSRRLDQGFDHYDDHTSDEIDLPERIHRWVEVAREPRFLWIQLGSETDLVEIDRLISRIEGLLDEDEGGTGVLFASLRGADRNAPELGLTTHRVPMIWRAPRVDRSDRAPRVSFALASPTDIAPTLVASARAPERETAIPQFMGRRLDELDAYEEERFLLLEGASVSHEIGIASAEALYVRSKSPLDVVGQPVPPTALADHAARFLAFRPPQTQEAKRAVLPEMDWRDDVLSADSPVPRLEFHLGRKLAEKISPETE